MREIKLIRRQNLQYLCDQWFHGDQAKMARFLEKSPSELSRLLNPDHSQPRNIGDSLALQLEQKLQLSKNWLDVDHSNERKPFPIINIPNNMIRETDSIYPIGGSSGEPPVQLDSEAVEFALRGLELAKDDPEFEEFCSMEWFVKVFKKLYVYRLSLNTPPENVDIKPILRLVA